MNTIRFAVGSFLFLALLAAASQAQGLQRTFVSGLGSDGNPCSRTAPCRTFTQAISQTNAGGEVYVLDSAGYGKVTIDKSVSIVCPLGVTAGITAFPGDHGIDVAAGAGDVVVLRGLIIASQGGDVGISSMNGASLYVESCVITGFHNLGGTGMTLGPGIYFVKDATVRDNYTGIFAPGGANGTSIAADRVALEGNSNIGLLVWGGVRAVLRDCELSGNLGGVSATAASTGIVAEIDLESCQLTNNGSGATAGTGDGGFALIRISGSTVIGNRFVGLEVDFGGFILSRGNNTIEGNGTNTSGTIGSYAAK